jgi:glycosyltransferase involved in cell wall biosynthesis
MKAARRKQAAKPLRVMIVCRNLAHGAGGMERTAANLVNYLAGKDCVAAVVYRQKLDGAPLYPIADKVHQFPVTADPVSLVDTAREFAPDVMVFFYATHDEAPHITALAQTDIPVILHEGSNPQRVIDDNWAKPKGLTLEQASIERLALMAMCTRMRFTLPVYRESLPPELMQDAVAFPNAFAPADEANLNIRSNEGRKIFLNIGGLKKVKNVMAAVRAFAMIADRLPDWDFHIFSHVSKSNPVAIEVRAFLRRAGLERRVKHFAPTPQIGREYGRSHIHVISSLQEGLPNCVAEAAVHALPSIGFACCPGTNFMIVPEHNGLLAECGDNDVGNLAAAMLRMAQDDESRERWGKAALEGSVVYDPARIFEQWHAVITDAAGDRAGLEGRHRRRFGDSSLGRLVRQVQKASLGAAPWPKEAPTPFDDKPPVVSIVVPVYNKAELVAETLQSIADCRYPAKEVIIVEDCSTDSSPQIVSEFCARLGWRMISHNQNSGLSAARNTGIEAATGEYVHFWDADDIYSQDGLNTIARAMWDNQADIGLGVATRNGEVMYRYRRWMLNTPPMTYGSDPTSFATPSSCFKVYRREFLLANDLRFVPGLFMQDSEFNLRAFPLAERIVASQAILGDYRLVEDSGTRQFHAGRFDSTLKIEELTYEFHAANGLHALETNRQLHVLSTVLPMFVQRSRKDHDIIDDRTPPEALDFDYLQRLTSRMLRMSRGLNAMDKGNPRLLLAYYAIRQGYLNWLPDLLSGRMPKADVATCLATSLEERQKIERLLPSLSVVQPAAASTGSRRRRPASQTVNDVQPSP